MNSRLVRVIVLCGLLFGLGVSDTVFGATDLTDVDLPTLCSSLQHDSTVILSEFSPNPESGEKEWVELFLSQGQAVLLDGWELHDSSGKIASLSGILTADNPYHVVELSSAKLNNGGDDVTVKDSTGKVIDTTTYTQPIEKTETYAFDDTTSEFRITTTPTKGAENSITAPAEETETDPPASNQETAASAGESESDVLQGADSQTGATSVSAAPAYVPLKDIPDLELGTMLTTKGVVSVEPGVLGSQFFYINGSGIQVYMFSKDFPALQLGDEVAVTGELSTSNGELRIKTKTKDDIVVIGTKELIPEVLAIEEISQDHVAEFVQTSGAITEKTSSHLFVDNGVAELKISTKALTDVLSGLSLEQDVVVSGIVRPRSDGLSLFPRGDFDIMLAVTSSTPEVTTTTPAVVPGNGDTPASDLELPMFQSALVLIGSGVLLVFFRKQQKADQPKLPLPAANPVVIKTGMEGRITELVALHADLKN